MPQVRRLGLLGGLFDPIHNGHLALCRAALEALKLERVLFIPAYHPPHRECVASYADRCRMTELALTDQGEFELSCLETQIEGPAYTVDTLRLVRRQYPETELFFVVGEDNLAKLKDWHDPETIFTLAQVVVANRPGTPPGPDSRFAARVVRIAMIPVEISSTEIREAVRQHRSISALVPPAVEKYIIEKKLYVG